MKVTIAESDWQRLLTHMDSSRERAAFMFARTVDSGVDVVDTWLLDDKDHYTAREADHLTLSDSVRPEVIARAHASNLAVIEAHSHWWAGPSTRFSQYDLAGLAEFAPHMLWRLPRRPYLALVIGQETFDGLWWRARSQFDTIDSLEAGPEAHRPTGLSLPRYQRLLDGGGA